MTPRNIAFALLIILGLLVLSSWDIIQLKWQEYTGPTKWWILAGCLAVLIVMVLHTILPYLRDFFS